MKKNIFSIFGRFGLLLFIFLSLSNSSCTRQSISPVVSADWLAKHGDVKNLVIVDIRSNKEYATGHIPNSINIPMEIPVSAWTVMKDELILEIPKKDDLFKTLGDNGIKNNSVVLIVTSGPASPPYPLADAARAAFTLTYAGLKNVSILDGGYAGWIGEGLPATTEIPEINPVKHNGSIKEKMLVSIDYVKTLTEQAKQKSILVDARDTSVYDGSVIEPFAARAGHIPTAKSLPAVLMWNKDGTYKSNQELKEIAGAVIGDNKKQEIVLYCGAGGYASAWWFVLTRVLDYQNVSIYDGSAQEWVKHYEMVLE